MSYEEKTDYTLTGKNKDDMLPKKFDSSKGTETILNFTVGNAGRLSSLVFLCFAVWGSAVVTCFSQNRASESTSPDVTKEIISETLEIDGKTVVVEKEIWELPEAGAGFEKTVRSFDIKDPAGTVYYSKTFSTMFSGEYGFEKEFRIRPEKISTLGKEALIINYSMIPSAPGSGHQMQFFALQGNTLEALSNPVYVYGSFGEMTRESENWTAELERDEIVIETSHSARYFYLNIPLKIDFGTKAGSPYETITKRDPVSGLEIIQTDVQQMADYARKKSPTVTLYHSPTGNKADRIKINEQTSVQIGPAYGETSVKEEKDLNSVEVSYTIKRLKVVLDGKTGFIEENDFSRVGLPAFG